MIGKNDLIKIANILNSNLYKSDGEFKSSLIRDLIEFLKLSNPNFDEVKFRDAVYSDKK